MPIVRKKRHDEQRCQSRMILISGFALQTVSSLYRRCGIFQDGRQRELRLRSMFEASKYTRLSSDTVHGVLHRHHGEGATTKRDDSSSLFDVTWGVRPPIVLQSAYVSDTLAFEFCGSTRSLATPVGCMPSGPHCCCRGKRCCPDYRAPLAMVSSSRRCRRCGCWCAGRVVLVAQCACRLPVQCVHRGRVGAVS